VAPEDEVVGQYPPAHASAEPGTAVSITVSSSPQVVVPDLVGLSLSQARIDLAKASLELIKNEAPSETVTQGAIIRQSLAAGTRLRKGNAVRVTVSSGPSTVEVPNLRGLRHAEAKDKLTMVRLKIDLQEGTPADNASGDSVVVGQTPEVATRVKQGSFVSLALSPSPSDALVPNLIGRGLAQARNELVDAGLRLGTTSKAPSDSVPEGKIFGQSPAAGTGVKRGRPVRVSLSVRDLSVLQVQEAEPGA
jgi:serine/threonine-protein kinase